MIMATIMGKLHMQVMTEFTFTLTCYTSQQHMEPSP